MEAVTHFNELLANLEEEKTRTTCLLGLWYEIRRKTEARHKATPKSKELEQDATVFSELVKLYESRITELQLKESPVADLRRMLNNTKAGGVPGHLMTVYVNTYQSLAKDLKNGETTLKAKSKSLSNGMTKETRSILSDIVIEIIAIGIGITRGQMREALGQVVREEDRVANGV
jgi:hypothetical protein